MMIIAESHSWKLGELLEYQNGCLASVAYIHTDGRYAVLAYHGHDASCDYHVAFTEDDREGLEMRDWIDPTDDEEGFKNFDKALDALFEIVLLRAPQRAG